jgi:YegS/Rv2252/BmrU family lipid kinase
MPNESIAVVLNVGAGRGYCDDDTGRLQELFARHGLVAKVFPASDGSEIVSQARAAVASKPSVVVAAGGDGTVSAVASCLKDTGIAMAVLPMGTLNHFARDLGIPADCEEAVAAIASGRRVAVDMGAVNDRPFVNNASIGIYPDIVRDRQRQQRRLGRGKFWAMLWAIHAVLKRSPFLRLHVQVDGEEHQIKSPFVFIGNNDYVMEGFSIGTRSSLRNGRLSIYTTGRKGRLGLLLLALRALFGRLEQAEDFVMDTARSLRIDTRRRRLLVATDGEVTAMDTPLDFRVLPGALQVIVPSA